jgi:hypothetical protein
LPTGQLLRKVVFLDGLIEVMGIALTPDEYMAFNWHACYTLGEEAWNAMTYDERLETVKRFRHAEG